MGKFVFLSEPGRVEPPPQPTLEDAAADDARINDLKNRFIDAKQQVLYTAPQAFLRQQGSNAITGAETTQQTLADLRQQALDQTANNDQRTRLSEMLDWHLADAQEQIHRHVAEQADTWQQNVAARTVELAIKQAALESADAEKVGFVALAAYDAEKARALKMDVPPEVAHESGRVAWSSAYKAAIETQAGTNPQQAVKLFDQAKATLDPQTRKTLQPRIDSFSLDAQADVLADKATAPDADRVSILDNPAVTPEVRLLAQIKITNRETIAAAARQSQIDTLDNRLVGDAPQALVKATYVPGTYAAIADGYASTGDPDKAAAARRLVVNELLLASFATAAPVDQMRMLSTLEPGPVRDQALRIKAASDRMLADDPLLWGTTAQRASVGELVPLDPQTLGRREQQARHVEALSSQPTLAMTRKEIAELKTALDTAPPAGKRTMLRNLANGLTGDAIARLAPELANQGPLADGYALALSAYAAKTPEQSTLADRILDGLDRMKAAGEGGRLVADTGPDWRRAFEAKIVSALPYLGEENAAALLTATAALYTQSMALKGKTRATLDGDELDNAIVAVSGGPAVKVERINTKLDGEVTDWVTRPGPDGQPRIKRPSPEIWNQLSDDQQQAVDAILAQNKQGTDVATDPKILDEIRRGLASDDPRERMRWAGVPLYQYKPYLSDADFRALLAVQSQYSPYTGLPREGLGHPIGTLEDHAELALTLLARKRMSGRPALARKPLPKPAGIPDHWTAKPSSKNGGTNYVNPTNTNDRVRVMPGTPSSPRPESQRPYVVHQRNGRFVDKHGQPIGGANPGQTPEAHIPYEEFIFRR